MTQSVRLAKALRDELVARAAAEPEHEICGVLLGPDDGRITRVIPARNVASDRRRRFELDPVALCATQRQARTLGLTIVGYYHSHPGGVAQPSGTDLAHAPPGQPLCVIATGTDVTAWRLDKGQASAVALEITDADSVGTVTEVL